MGTSFRLPGFELSIKELLTRADLWADESEEK
jgi:hypothetical protein